MAKLFQTISLEERLKNSSHNKLPEKPGPVKQGSSNIRYPQDLLKKEGYLLKLTPNAQKENSEILKGYLTSKLIPELPAIKTNFGSKVSLEDRLKQRLLGTTQHLAQYYLSDLYTDYIKIKPFGVYNHTSTVEIKALGIFNHTSTINVDTPVASIIQGGTNPTPFIFDSILAQGVKFSNNVYSSYTTILFPGLVNQGPGTDPTLPPTSVNQGPGVDPTLPPTLVNQGPGTDPTNPASILDIQLSQGLFVDMQGNLSSLVNTIFAAPNPANVVVPVPTSIVIGQPTSTATMLQSQLLSIPANVIVQPFAFQPNFTTPVLEVLKYEADRALALYLPKVKHGSSFIQTYYASDDVNKHGFVDIPIQYLNSNENAPIYLNTGVPPVDTPQKASGFTINAALSQEGVDFLPGIVDTYAASKFPIADNTEAQVRPNSLYTTLNYEQIVKRATGEDTRKDFRQTLGIRVVTSQTTGKTETINYDRKNVDLKGTDSAATDDFVDFTIKSIVTKESVKFRAFITTFGDSFNTTWSDYNYVGRQDVLKMFKNATRTSNIAFKIAAFNADDLKSQYTRLNNFTKIAAVGRLGSTNKYVTGPVCSITLGRWFKNTPCVFNSIKFDIQMADYSWDIDRQVPHLIDVSLDLAILGDISGKPLNAATNNYFDYIG